MNQKATIDANSLSKVLDAALELFESDAEAVNAWMTAPVRRLSFKAPLEILGTREES